MSSHARTQWQALGLGFLKSSREGRLAKRSRVASRNGFVLLTVVVMLAICTLMLARLATYSMQEASIALEEERELRQRWASTSIRRFSLDVASEVLAGTAVVNEHNPRTTLPNAHLSPIANREFQLGGYLWRIVIADESSKLHFGRLSAEFAVEKSQTIGEELLTGNTTLAFTAFSRQLAPSRKRWERWLDDGVANGLTSPAALATATQNLTLWGDGRVNIQRCDDVVLNALWNALFSRDAPLSIQQSRSGPNRDLQQILASAGLRDSQLEIANRWMTDESTCYSVWLFCQSDRRVPAAQFVKWGVSESRAEHRGYEY